MGDPLEVGIWGHVASQPTHLMGCAMINLTYLQTGLPLSTAVVMNDQVRFVSLWPLRRILGALLSWSQGMHYSRFRDVHSLCIGNCGACRSKWQAADQADKPSRSAPHLGRVVQSAIEADKKLIVDFREGFAFAHTMSAFLFHV